MIIALEARLRSVRTAIPGFDHHFLRHPRQHLHSSSSRKSLQTTCALPAGLDSSNLPLIAGGAVAVLGAVALGVQLSQQGPGSQAATAMSTGSNSSKRNNAVLVFGASGKLGRFIVAELLKKGRSVVAAGRDADRTSAALAELGLQAGQQPSPGGSGNGSKGPMLEVEGGWDVTDRAGLGQAQRWQGVSQVVCALGSKFGRQQNGSMGYIDGMSPERVDKEGVTNVAQAAAKTLQRQPRQVQTTQVFSMSSKSDLAKWKSLDDPVMGGKSSSSISLSEAGNFLWSGEVITEGGGFCGNRVQADLNLQAYDGLAFKVKGDGLTIKCSLKTAGINNKPACAYQASFDTVAGQTADVRLAWHEFQPVDKAVIIDSLPPLDPSQITGFGFNHSRFSFNGLPNPRFHDGAFTMEVVGGLHAWRAPRTEVLLVSSAAVERNARIGNDAAARKADIPIVQLNPGGVLNQKYAGETALRSSGAAYTILRPVGLSREKEEESFELEASQGDRIVGIISRQEVAVLTAAALDSPASAGKTIEFRRRSKEESRGLQPDLSSLFLAAVEDRHRPRINLPYLPAPVAPPPPPSEDRKQEILQDSRVQAAMQRNRQPDDGKVNQSEESRQPVGAGR
ncbi:hypothetical protein WJX74_010569 [Apatococcus lobatus]|uniref:NAD(P)-binding domain-containing protein n=1 Tax=Apatococcus lobatus TaxID=904363 RepID=A0AAW1SFM6_9CHLO